MKKLFSIILVVVMVLGLVPMAALAAEVPETPLGEEFQAAETFEAPVVKAPKARTTVDLFAAGAIPAAGGNLASGEYALTEDLAVSSAVTVPVGETVTIDLGGHTLDVTPSTGNFAVINEGTLTLKNGKVTKTNGYGIANFGNAKVEDVELATDDVALRMSGGTCEMVNCDIKTTDGYAYGIWCYGDGDELILKNVTMSTDYFSIYTQNNSACNITLEDCTIYGEVRALNQWGTGTVSASGTTFKSAAGSQPLEFNHGAVELSNGTTVLEGDEPGRMIVKDATVTADRTVVAAKGSLMSTTWQSAAGAYETAPEGFAVDGDTVTISSELALGWWAAHYADYSGKTVELAADLDLDAYLWDPMEVVTGKTVTIDGKGHTISNLIVTGYRYMNAAGTTYYSGFIGKLNGSAKAFISNVTFENADVEIGGNIIGAVVGVCSGRVELTNVKVKDSLVNGFGKVGGLVGQLAYGAVVLTSCSVENTTISGSSNCAGLVGLKMGGTTLTITDCAVENVTWRKSIGTDYSCLDTTATHKCNLDDCTAQGAAEQSIKGRFAYYDDGEVFYAAWGDLYTDYEGWCIAEAEGEDATYVFVGLCHNLSDDGDMFRGENDLHVWGAWEVTTDPSCTEKGEETRVCAICGEDEKQDVDALGHAWGEWEETAAPKCFEDGVKIRTCSACGAEEEGTVSSIGHHTWGEWEETTAPKCFEDGVKTRVCSVCGGKEEDAIPAIGHHTWSEWTTTVAAEPGKAGEETRTCTYGDCDASETRTTYAVIFDQANGEDTTYVTVVENETVSQPEEPAKEGFLFDGWFTEDGAAWDFEHDAVTGEVTLTAGWTCDGHIWDEGVVTVEPTKEANGEKVYTCTKCGATKTVELEKVIETVTETVTETVVETVTETVIVRVPVEASTEVIEDEETPLAGLPNVFLDVKDADWFAPAVGKVSGAGIMFGINDGTMFDPYGSLTRAMAITTIYRLAGSPAAEGEVAYPDVLDEQWYTAAVIWGTQTGVIEGYDTGDFGPNDLVTREQMALMMMRYAKYIGEDVDVTGFELTLVEGDSVSEWAMTAMRWAVKKGVMKGREDGKLDGRGTATRAEMASVLMGYMTSDQEVLL